MGVGGVVGVELVVGAPAWMGKGMDTAGVVVGIGCGSGSRRGRTGSGASGSRPSVACWGPHVVGRAFLAIVADLRCVGGRCGLSLSTQPRSVGDVSGFGGVRRTVSVCGAIAPVGRFWPGRLASASRGEVEGRSCVGKGTAAGVARSWPEEVPDEQLGKGRSSLGLAREGGW